MAIDTIDWCVQATAKGWLFYYISRTLSIYWYEVGIMRKNTNDERNRLAIDTIGVFKRQRRRGGCFINKDAEYGIRYEAGIMKKKEY